MPDYCDLCDREHSPICQGAREPGDLVQLTHHEWHQPGDPSLGRSPFGYTTSEAVCDSRAIARRYAHIIDAISVFPERSDP